ncbi:class C beta-lactamase [Ciceribacter azotifigens]|uniref:class C beta-lactamase n=1 Tax=Ciceribacter azotifigens TaxID=2069303 RepID=UPI003A89632F
MRNSLVARSIASATVAISILGTCTVATADDIESRLQRAADEAIQPIMKTYKVPGTAVAVTVQGRRYVFNYGVASVESGKKVDDATLFEIGSISKTFTATLASYAHETGALSFSDSPGKYVPDLVGSTFDKVSLLHLATYTAGGLPLQFPNDVTQKNVIAYYRDWHPDHSPGTHRRYSNPSIGLFGYAAAASMGVSFDDVMQGTLFPMLGLSNTYIHVPKKRTSDYAYGYSKTGKPIHASPGAMDSEAYGVKTSASDLIRFVEANMNGQGLDAPLQRAITATHTGYYRVAGMTQGLGWEMYDYPVKLDMLLAGNSPEISNKSNAVEALDPPAEPRKNVWINKTGSTAGFGAYAAFVPERQIGVVILANRNYPIPDRLRAAYRIVTALDGGLGD